MEPQQFARLGQTRSVVKRHYALIAPDSHVRAPLPAWSVNGTSASGIVLISPAMGARLAQTLVLLNEGQAQLHPSEGVERFLFVLEGALDWGGQTLSSGSYAFLPPGEGAQMEVTESARLLCFEKRFVPLQVLVEPTRIIGHERDIEAAPYLGDPALRLKTLLLDAPAFDMAANIFTYDPGATLPFVETHVMEHGLLMLQGEGIYRLGDDWHPVAQGDTIWMASFCPQWFAATGKTPARYLYYKDVNREVLS